MEQAERRPRILFLCTHNKARSQLAEGICRKLGGGAVEVESAGNEPSAVHPLATRVLAAMGIDASGHRSKHMDELRGQRFDYVVTVCDNVREKCPVFAGDPERIHWSLRDPTQVVGAEEAQLAAFEQTARQLETRVRGLLSRLELEKERG